MIIRIESLRTEPNQKLEYKYETSEIESLKVVKPLVIEGTAKLLDEEMFISGSYSVTLATPCVKCLKEIEVYLEGEFDGHYSDSKNYKEYLSSLKKECDVKENYLDEAVNGEIDLTELVREFIILDMPPYPSCEPQCDGLEEMDKYSKEDAIDPRWQELLKIKN